MAISTGTRVFLGIQTLIWLPYGVFCFFQPELLGTAAGIVLGSATASTEIRAMYGGLEAAIGAMTLAGLLRADWTRTALSLLAFLCTGLATARFGGILLDGAISSYTVAGLAFETVSAGFAIKLLSSGRSVR
jgi:Domain of unknown function (DUF4345)